VNSFENAPAFKKPKTKKFFLMLKSNVFILKVFLPRCIFYLEAPRFQFLPPCSREGPTVKEHACLIFNTHTFNLVFKRTLFIIINPTSVLWFFEDFFKQHV
jgi:hypothetical protein